MRIFQRLDFINSFYDLVYLVHRLNDKFARQDGSFGLGKSQPVRFIAINSRSQRLEVVQHSLGSWEPFYLHVGQVFELRKCLQRPSEELSFAQHLIEVELWHYRLGHREFDLEGS